MQEHKAIENSEDVCFNCLKNYIVHKIEISSMGYGSGFDNWSTRLNLCDDCMKLTNSEWWELREKQCDWDKEENHGFYEYEFEDEIFDFVRKMPVEGRELFNNRYSTDSYQMESQDWIDYELDILPHERCKEYGMYSPQEIKAYNDRFPTCQHVSNRIWNDGSRGSWCPFRASGDYGQICSINMSDECYLCEHFTERNTPIRDILAEDYKDYEVYYKAKLNGDKYKNKFELE